MRRTSKRDSTSGNFTLILCLVLRGEGKGRRLQLQYGNFQLIRNSVAEKIALSCNTLNTITPFMTLVYVKFYMINNYQNLHISKATRTVKFVLI